MANSIELATFGRRRRHVTQADRLLDFLCVCVYMRHNSTTREKEQTGWRRQKMWVCGRRCWSSGEAFVTSWPLRLRPGLKAGPVPAGAETGPPPGSQEPWRLLHTLEHRAAVERKKKRLQPLTLTHSLHLLPISLQTEDGRCAVPLRSLSAPAHSGVIVRARGVGRVALHCKLQGDAVAGFLTDSAHCLPCSSPSLGGEKQTEAREEARWTGPIHPGKVLVCTAPPCLCLQRHLGTNLNVCTL